MKIFTPTISMLTLALCVLPSRAQIIDDFSGTTATDSGNYNALLPYAPFGDPAQAFSINGSHQLQPTGTGVTTTVFLRNTGQYLGAGDSVSIDDVSQNNYSLNGLRLSTSVSSLNNGPGATDNSFEFGILGDISPGTNTSLVTTNGSIYAAGTLLGSLSLNFSLGSVTETLTRDSLTDTLFHFTLAGSGLTSGTVTGSFTYAAAAGQNIYFGPDFFANTNAGAQIADNLAFTPAEVPEPSTYAMMFAGLIFLGALIRRKSGLSHK